MRMISLIATYILLRRECLTLGGVVLRSRCLRLQVTVDGGELRYIIPEIISNNLAGDLWENGYWNNATRSGISLSLCITWFLL